MSFSEVSVSEMFFGEMPRRSSRLPGAMRRVALILSLALVAASCGGSDSAIPDADSDGTPRTIPLAPPAPETEPIITTTTLPPTTTSLPEEEPEEEEDEAEEEETSTATTARPRTTVPPATAPQTTTTIPTTDPETGETIVPSSTQPTAFERPRDRGTIEWEDPQKDDIFGQGCTPRSETSLASGDWAGYVSNITELTLVFDVVCLTFVDGSYIVNDEVQALELPVSSNIRALLGEDEVTLSEFASSTTNSVVFIRVRDGVVTLLVQQQL